MKKLCFNLNRYFSVSFSEYKNATIVDNRPNKDENPLVIFTCEHALNTYVHKICINKIIYQKFTVKIQMGGL